MKFFLLIVRNVRRNLLRSVLTAIVTVVLVCVVTMVWSILSLLDYLTTEKSENFRAMVTERWSIPSRMPMSYADSLARGAARNPGDIRPTDSMTWQFYIGTLDKRKMTRESFLFAVGVDPAKVLTMMDGLDLLEGNEKALVEQYVEQMKVRRQGVIVGRNHARNLLSDTRYQEAAGEAPRQRRLEEVIGKKINLTGMFNHTGLDLEFEIVGLFPPGRYETMAVFNRDYLNTAFEAYQRKNNGRKHPLADRNLNLVWLKVPNTDAFRQVAAQIESSPLFSNPAVKCETAASGYSTFLGGFRDFIWGVRWLLAPACLFTVLLVIANAISLSVRERRAEMAVLKVLGFRPAQILALVLGESLLLGAGAGLIGSGGTYLLVTWVLGGISFPIGFFDRFLVPPDAIWWGPVVGGLAALAGSFLPAWTARNVKVAEVFAKVA
jgi:putative ABC transport system permease protein